MQASECCIIRVAIASILGGIAAFAVLWQHSAVAALLLSPFFGSAAAIAAITLFWFVSLFVPCQPVPEEARARL
ncbi:hypothetical protein Q8W71_04870 [Methylobacterium sp. NEAU 140]|uniref:hypothetical protein n=1 Tax=Methylobacterium sp. NEAU 140 TaxID=3064945 RepID=UPI002735C898|nr:hypothetical protein [Methylobacterium sp. NEAU 140]MDP4021950.1 hypothetical protein [Methylobacterium sp. NEAU 140]